MTDLETEGEVVPIAGCAAKASSHPLTSTLIRSGDEPHGQHQQARYQYSAVQREAKVRGWGDRILSREGREERREREKLSRVDGTHTSSSQMRRAARRASASDAKGEAAAIAAAKRRLPLTRSTSSAERSLGAAITPTDTTQFDSAKGKPGRAVAAGFRVRSASAS